MSRGVVLLLCVFVAVIVFGECRDDRQQPRGKHSSEEGSCRFWCRQKGGRDVKYYCCDNEAQNSGRDKNGVCPSERGTCPKVQAPALKAPKDCKKDTDCRGTEMCCFDSCLKRRTCSIAQDHSTGGRHRSRRGLRAGNLDFAPKRSGRRNVA